MCAVVGTWGPSQCGGQPAFSAMTVDAGPRCRRLENGRSLSAKSGPPNNGVLLSTSGVWGQDKCFLFRRFDGALAVIGPDPGDGLRSGATGQHREAGEGSTRPTLAAQAAELILVNDRHSP